MPVESAVRREEGAGLGKCEPSSASLRRNLPGGQGRWAQAVCKPEQRRAADRRGLGALCLAPLYVHV